MLSEADVKKWRKQIEEIGCVRLSLNEVRELITTCLAAMAQHRELLEAYNALHEDWKSEQTRANKAEEALEIKSHEFAGVPCLWPIHSHTTIGDGLSAEVSSATFNCKICSPCRERAKRKEQSDAVTLEKKGVVT